MKYRPFGATGLNCSIVGLGTGRIASVESGISQKSADQLVHTAADLGINLIDTADSYAQGESEKRVGHAIRGSRERFIIVSKAGYYFSSLGGGLRLLKPLAKKVIKLFKSGSGMVQGVRSNTSRQDFSPAYIKAHIEDSLTRLGTDWIDIFLLHSPPLEAVRNETLFAILRDIKKEGKIRHFGISTASAEVISHASTIPGLTATQMPVNPSRASAPAMLAKCYSAGIGVIANQIFLSGQLIKESAPAKDAPLTDLKSRLSQIAASKGASLNRLLIEHALSLDGVSTILSGTNNPAHLKQNVEDALASPLFQGVTLPTLVQA